jgi:hypothetical protein
MKIGGSHLLREEAGMSWSGRVTLKKHADYDNGIFWELSIGFHHSGGIDILESTGYTAIGSAGGRDAHEYLLIPPEALPRLGKLLAIRERDVESVHAALVDHARHCKVRRLADAAAMLDELGIRYEKRFTVWRDSD